MITRMAPTVAEIRLPKKPHDVDAEQPGEEIADDRADDAHDDVQRTGPWSERVSFSASQPASAPMMMAMKKPTPGCPSAP